jgi:FkbM family methyltransferase
MLPTLSIRSFSNDQYLLDKVFYANHYRLKGFKEGENQPVVLDIGAHAGYFTFAAVSLGAKKVFAIEIHPDNYRALAENTAHGSVVEKVIPLNFGVYTENCTLTFAGGGMVDGIYYDFSEIRLDVVTSPMYHMPAFTLDRILSEYVRENIDILKLNIGYAETDILLGSKLIDSRVKAICLESGDDAIKLNDFIKKMKEKGFKDSLIHKIPEEEKTLILLARDKVEQFFNI